MLHHFLIQLWFISTYNFQNRRDRFQLHSKKTFFSSLRHNDTLWRHRSGSTLDQVLACSLTAPSHYLNQCCFIIGEIQWNSFYKTSAISYQNSLENYYLKFNSNLPRADDFVEMQLEIGHDDVIIWKHFPRFCSFVRRIHRSPLNYPYKGQWSGALMFSLICAWIHGRVNNGEAGDLRRNRAHYDIIVMLCKKTKGQCAELYFGWKFYGC